MEQKYDKTIYRTLKTAIVPGLVAGGYWANNLAQNISQYDAEQIFVAGGAALICGGTGLLGLFARKKHFALEDKLKESKKSK